MHFSSLAAFACLVISASAFDYPEFVPLHRRQEPGTPAYECHANCGGVITSSRSDDFCDSSTFKSQLSECLKCANEFDIWKYYGSSVSKAAESCGLDSTPVDADDDGSSTTVQPAPTTSAGSSATTTEAHSEAPTKEATTSAEAEDSTTAPGTTAPSATQSLTTTASAAGSSHPVIPTGSKSTPVSGSGTPTGQAVRSSS
ncbi:hypothetical protein P170DRAFT_355024 [Aspergillus steynii IBT 23096]|uniref:Uncharacterized protein n=1 Tax=Aspergillus steynii IBT 23096 TaxID=1392250 RepID=A0A2I2GEM3_9EURO|nr:uncharacterized protein P170DRAFT_355024 [Aspergillus steynii IBT 23096]PLB51348.1 hypothetical protein P170DRAFT_355024 [Aspergillus steynii IBT 23096]